MSTGRLDVDMSHVQVGRHCNLDRKKRSEHSHPQARAARAARAATCDRGMFVHSGSHNPPGLHYLATLENDAVGPSGPRTRVRKAYDGAMGGGGPKPTGNRGASGFDVRSLVGRLNQTVSIHLEMTDAPTHHNPGIHGSHPRVRRLARPKNPPRPTGNDPSREDQRGQS